MKFIYTSDVHGDVYKYERLLEQAKNNDIEYIVLGGDILPKKGDRTIIQPEFIENELDKYFKKLNDCKIKCILIPGNDDLENFDEELSEICNKYPNIYDIDRKRLDINDVTFIGLSNVLDNPFARKNRVFVEDESEMQPQLSDKIYVEKGTKIISVEEWKEYRKKNVEKTEDVLASLPEIDKTKKTIYVFHGPPYGIGLDECEGNLKVGSKVVKKFLENSNCYMSLHGHIHESPKMSGLWYNKLGNTICIQPGQTELGNKTFYYVIIDTDLNEKTRYDK